MQSGPQSAHSTGSTHHETLLALSGDSPEGSSLIASAMARTKSQSQLLIDQIFWTQLAEEA